MNKAYAAETFGTFILSLVVLVVVSQSIQNGALYIGATLSLLVYTIGPISGAHVNPAVTLSLWYLKKGITGSTALSYVASQVVGAILALLTANLFVDHLAVKLKGVQALVETTPAIFIGEMLGTALLVWGVSSVVSGKVSKSLSGIVIGTSLFLGITVASVASNAVLNPAVALALGSINAVYMVAPILGGIIGGLAYQFLSTQVSIQTVTHKKTTRAVNARVRKK